MTLNLELASQTLVLLRTCSLTVFAPSDTAFKNLAHLPLSLLRYHLLPHVFSLHSLTASELGIGKGNFLNGASGGAGHGGRGGSGYFNGRVNIGGDEYENAILPCELGSGTEGPNESYGHVVGGRMIVMGSIQWPLLSLDLYGSLRADGQSFSKAITSSDGSLVGGLGGGSEREGVGEEVVAEEGEWEVCEILEGNVGGGEDSEGTGSWRDEGL